MTADQVPPDGPLPDDLDAVIDAIDNLPPASQDHGNASLDVARARTRRTQAMRLRLAGATYDQIAAQAGYQSRGGARQAVLRGLAQIEADTIQDLRTLEDARLDADELVLRAIIGDAKVAPGRRIQAVDSRVRLSARRARLWGLDHADGIAERALQLEADKVRLVAVALGKAMDAVGLDPEQRDRVQGVLIAELRAGEGQPPTLTEDDRV